MDAATITPGLAEDAMRRSMQRIVGRQSLTKQYRSILAALRKVNAEIKRAKLKCEPPRPKEGQRILLYGSGKFGARALATGDASEGVYHEKGELGRPHIVCDSGQMISYWGGPIWKPCNK